MLYHNLHPNQLELVIQMLYHILFEFSINYLKHLEVTQSFSKPGVPYDNSVMETFFASMKQEELYRYNYRSEREFRAAVDRYIDFYNTKRPHKTLHYKTPVQKEENYARGTIVSKDWWFRQGCSNRTFFWISAPIFGSLEIGVQLNNEMCGLKKPLFAMQKQKQP